MNYQPNHRLIEKGFAEDEKTVAEVRACLASQIAKMENTLELLELLDAVDGKAIAKAAMDSLDDLKDGLRDEGLFELTPAVYAKTGNRYVPLLPDFVDHLKDSGVPTRGWV